MGVTAADSNAALQARREAAVPRGLGIQMPVFAAKAENAEITDVEGKRYIDFAAGIAVLNTGHLHPKIKAAVTAQLDNFSHTCIQVMPYEGYIRLAERLNATVPTRGPRKTVFLTTGAEAIENAVKIARHHTGRNGVIAFSGAFHGRTLLGMALTGKVVPYKAGFGSMPGEIYHLPFPVAYHGKEVEQTLEALEVMFRADVDPKRIAAMIIEPVQGEGGFYIAQAELLAGLRRICDEHGIVMIVDEVQTGFARTGKMFAIEHSGVEPDMITMAKSLAGGFPLSAVTGKAEIMDSPAAGGLGGTYGGNPLALAAGNAVLDIIEEEGLCARAEQIGELLTGRLKELQNSNSLKGVIGDIRGLGAMVAMELVAGGDANRPDPDLAKALTARAAQKGLILLSCGVRGNVIRFLVPLTASDALINEGMDMLGEALRECVAERAA
ncbi:4-aminobutyrate--2-oxoglutarate transaminase [Pseudoroseomonas cervicalis]|uniref:4-aminobutyrate--2-oxoglutarate transaminase n=1 Tax=Teichococcus cervicalis TaxID=204525 RepID=UPI002781BE13|nr:4-aminobutyrate--2-oxoglutarate transaminase [Pseudoroseomonas cervicalis]MDQ1081235.1 4-aminobutyrate aminotransferase/(S)-3-amino-2-methylpropionate transaminase [Pseudoroseomonas cervicalis]